MRRESFSRSITFGDGPILTRRPRRAARTLAAARRVDRQVARGSLTLLRVAGVLQTCDVVGLAAAEDVADLLAAIMRRRGAAHVARFQAVALRLREVDLDLICGESTGVRRRVARRPSTCEMPSCTSSALPVEHVQVLAEDADDDRLARPREHLFDPLVEVGLHVVERPGIPVDDLLDLATVCS